MLVVHPATGVPNAGVSGRQTPGSRFKARSTDAIPSKSDQRPVAVHPKPPMSADKDHQSRNRHTSPDASPLTFNLPEFYPMEFSDVDIKTLENQLENYILDVRTNSRFAALKGLVDLSMKMVSTKKAVTYQHVLTLIRLALLLLVATASVERAFSAMKFVKNELQNKICDQWLNDCLVTYIERYLCYY